MIVNNINYSNTNFGVNLTGNRAALAREISKYKKFASDEENQMINYCCKIIKNGLKDKELNITYKVDTYKAKLPFLNKYCTYDGYIQKKLIIEDKNEEILKNPEVIMLYRETEPTKVNFTRALANVAEKVASLHLGRRIKINNGTDAEKINKEIKATV